MATTTAISANPQKNNGATFLHGGNIANSTIDNNLTLATNTVSGAKGSKVHLAVSPNDSGNLGGIKALSAGVFADMEADKYVGKIIGTRIAQTANTLLRSPASDKGNRDSLHYGKGNHYVGITTWDIYGSPTFNGNRGTLFTYHDPVANAAIASEPRPTSTTPGELVYRDGSPTPIQDDYTGASDW